MDVPTLNTFLSLILTVASVWNTWETGDNNRACHKKVSSSIQGLAMPQCFSIRIPGTFFGEPEGVPQDFF